MSKAKKDKDFAAQVLVTRDADGDGGTFLIAHDAPDTIEHGQKVAVYGLVEIATMKVTREIVRADGSVVSILD